MVVFMPTLILVLLIAGFVLFLLAGLNVSSGRVSLLGLGLACWILTVILANPLVHAG